MVLSPSQVLRRNQMTLTSLCSLTTTTNTSVHIRRKSCIKLTCTAKSAYIRGKFEYLPVWSEQSTDYNVRTHAEYP